MACNPPGSSVHGILQARILAWVAVSSQSSWLRDWTLVSASPALAGGFFTAAPLEKPNVLDDTPNIQPKTGMPPKLQLCHLFRPPPRVCVKGICPGGALPGLNTHTHTQQQPTYQTSTVRESGLDVWNYNSNQPPQLEGSTGFKETATLSLALQQGDSLERTSNVE